MYDAPQDITTRYEKTTTYFRYMIYVIKLYIFTIMYYNKIDHALHVCVVK